MIKATEYSAQQTTRLETMCSPLEFSFPLLFSSWSSVINLTFLRERF